MSEWIDPRYAEPVAAWKRSQQPTSRDPKEERPVRGFVTPPKPWRLHRLRPRPATSTAGRGRFPS
ncbi:hypothetical protein ACVV2G_00145 [Streptomyces ziwulingensis]